MTGQIRVLQHLGRARRLDEQLGRIVDEFLEREIEPNSLLGSGYRTVSRIDDFKMEH